MKALPHAAHWKGCSRVWIRRCFSGDELRPNALPHSVQPKGFPTASGVEGAKPLGMLSLRMPSRRAPSSRGLARRGAQGRAAADRGPRLTPPGAQGPGRSRALRTGPRASRVHMPPKAGTHAPLLSGPCATAPTSALSSAMTSLGPDSFISGLVSKSGGKEDDVHVVSNAGRPSEAGRARPRAQTEQPPSGPTRAGIKEAGLHR